MMYIIRYRAPHSHPVGLVQLSAPCNLITTHTRQYHTNKNHHEIRQPCNHQSIGVKFVPQVSKLNCREMFVIVAFLLGLIPGTIDRLVCVYCGEVFQARMLVWWLGCKSVLLCFVVLLLFSLHCSVLFTQAAFVLSSG